MNMASDLGESYQRLLELEKGLNNERNGLVNHVAVKQMAACNSSMHYQYASMVDKYNGSAEVYNKELQRFKSLLDQSVSLQQEVINTAYKAYAASIASSSPSPSAVLMNDDNNGNNLNEDNEINHNELASTAVSEPTMESAIQYASSRDGDHVSAREIATPQTEADEYEVEFTSRRSETNSVRGNERQIHDSNFGTRTRINSSTVNHGDKKKKKTTPAAPKKSTPQRKTLRPQKKTTQMVVKNNMRYKYQGKGFEVWKKNGQRAIYQSTKLKCTQTFSNEAGKQKLTQWLIKRGGLAANVIEAIECDDTNDQSGRFTMITVRTSKQNILRAVNKLNHGKRRPMIWIHYPHRYYVNANKGANNKLFVTDFDILSANDHRAMTDLFLRFGQLAGDILMSKDRNGNPFAVVTYQEQRDAVSCVQHRNSHFGIRFNGKELNVRYHSEEKRKASQNKKNSANTRKYRK